MNNKITFPLFFALTFNLLLPGLALGTDEYDSQSLVEAEFNSIREHICPPADAPGLNLEEMFDTEKQRMDPVRVFDNLYFVGMKTVSAWALTTSEGIILMDAMLHFNVKETVIDGLNKLGLDPAKIRYAIISHGHNDHFGGAKYLQDTYDTRIVMSAADWDHIEVWPQLGSPAPLPRRDIEVNNGDTITLGDTTVTIVVTPGHTPGTISPVFPVKDQGRKHLVGYWGGAAVSYLPPEELEIYIRSASAYAEIDDRIDVELSNHPFADGSLLKFKVLAGRNQGDPHPFVTGNQVFKQWMSVIRDCAGVILARKQKVSED